MSRRSKASVDEMCAFRAARGYLGRTFSISSREPRFFNRHRRLHSLRIAAPAPHPKNQLYPFFSRPEKLDKTIPQTRAPGFLHQRPPR
jgi:hypothetical protein